VRSFARWATYVVLETHSAETRQFEGRTVGDIAVEQGKTPWDTLVDIVIADRLHTAIAQPDEAQDDQSWQRRVEVWRDERTLVGASDAGAHLDMIDSFAYTTRLLGEAMRKRRLLSVEEAVHLLTDRPARLYGLRRRGRIQTGWWADLVIFDPDRVDTAPVRTRFDLPAGGTRLYAGALGINHVFVNGVEIARADEITGDRPGRVLRSGTDTDTVTAST
jgi:N-acyl-D-aspartate/D-glutamate deacylase